MQSYFDNFVRPKLSISQLELAVQILMIYNCRASEVLSAEWSNYFPDRFLILRGAKKSANIIITDRIILSQVASLPYLDEKKIFPSINYYHLYHYVKKHYSHQFVKYKKRKNFKVTHGFRYRAVEQIANEAIIQDILHHRSTKSGKFYK
jgi:integrase